MEANEDLHNGMMGGSTLETFPILLRVCAEDEGHRDARSLLREIFCRSVLVTRRAEPWVSRFGGSFGASLIKSPLETCPSYDGDGGTAQTELGPPMGGESEGDYPILLRV